ncbi:MAG TPA: hypothetical protein VM287_00120 [Egibacteraceae bacterium]|nr:hypothetical protein [Egibacteraceae bacterium]
MRIVAVALSKASSPRSLEGLWMWPLIIGPLLAAGVMVVRSYR